MQTRREKESEEDMSEIIKNYSNILEKFFSTITISYGKHFLLI